MRMRVHKAHPEHRLTHHQLCPLHPFPQVTITNKKDEITKQRNSEIATPTTMETVATRKRAS